jgi:CII-binding regulator of phage lambda lysogenization HflD
MTEDDITRFCGVLGSLGGGKDPLVEELESRWEDLETQLKKYTEHLTMMESQLKKSGSKLLGTLKRLDTERSADTRYANQSCQFVRNKIRERATVP